MGRMTTAFTAAAASGLTALAVTVAVPALADDTTPPDKGATKVEHRENGPTPQALQACLTSHGATGVPGPDEDEGRALKQWIVAHQSDASAKAALQACDVYFEDGKKPNQGQPSDNSDCAGKAAGGVAPDTASAAKARTASKARAARRPTT